MIVTSRLGTGKTITCFYSVQDTCRLQNVDKPVGWKYIDFKTCRYASTPQAFWVVIDCEHTDLFIVSLFIKTAEQAGFELPV